MIYINLLPWRESQSWRLLKKFAFQFLITLTVLGIVLAMLWLKLWYEFKQMGQEQIVFELAHQDELESMAQYEFHQGKEKKLLQQLDQVNHLIDQRHTIPDLLSTLTRNRLAQPIEYLAIDHQGLIIRGLDWTDGDAQSLFQRLQNNPNYCQVSLLPSQRQVDPGSALEFELQAELCDAETSG